MTRVAIIGASGRMGRALVRLTAADEDLTLVGAFGTNDVGRDAGELAGTGAVNIRIRDRLEALDEVRAGVAIDFSTASALPEVLAACTKTGTALVTGTTGFDESLLDAAAHSIPILWEPNMSVGIFVLSELVMHAARMLGPQYDIEVIEVHHRKKVDAPSGTAKRLVDVAVESRSGETQIVYGREGLPGARPASELGVHAVRGGDVIGDHTVCFFGEGERLELTHRATHRDLFAQGALRAAKWITGRAPGRYTLRDVLSSIDR